MSINALDICEEIQKSKTCQEASVFYAKNRCDRDDVLTQGSADFDKPVTNLPDEKSHYRAAYYMGDDGYMYYMDNNGDRFGHIEDNKCAFEKCNLVDGLNQKQTLFVDFGCGPMTAGLVLAEKLSAGADDYKTRTTYLGIDTSQNMCHFARKINEHYDIFTEDKFHIKKQDTFPSQMIETIPSPDVAILCFSFALAPNTYKTLPPARAAVESLATEWYEFLCKWTNCRETRIIYLNPNHNGFHGNWQFFTEKLMSLANTSNLWDYAKAEYDVIVSGKVKIVEMITGTRKG